VSLLLKEEVFIFILVLIFSRSAVIFGYELTFAEPSNFDVALKRATNPWN